MPYFIIYVYTLHAMNDLSDKCLIEWEMDLDVLKDHEWCHDPVREIKKNIENAWFSQKMVLNLDLPLEG